MNKFYTKSEIITFFVLECVSQNIEKINTTEKLQTEAKFWLNGFKLDLENLENWKNYDFSYENFRQLYRQILDLDFETTNVNYFVELVDPIKWEESKVWTVFNEISKKDGEFRDLYILNRVEEKSLKFKKILIIYGGHHLYTLEPGLKEIGKNQ